MADNKNQHFVPKCHLKPFASTEDGSAIHLYNPKAGRCIFDAPTKGQCARSYFYGKDLDLERKLGQAEGAYGAAIRQVMQGGDLRDAAVFLRDFSYLQLSRTEAFMNARRRFMSGLDDVVYEGHEAVREDFTQEEWETARAAIDMFAETLPSIRDLKPIIVLNKTDIPFLTSDNPAVHTNRLHLQKLKERSFGLVQSGCMFVMPLTVRHSIISYDPDVYTIGWAQNGVVAIDRDTDVHAMNQFQVINCANNIYFGSRDHADYARWAYEAYADLKVGDTHFFDVLVPDGSDAEGERFRSATQEERLTASRKFIVTSSRFPQPREWPAFMSYRAGARGYTNGSAAGFIRHDRIADRGGGQYRKHTF